MPVTGHSMNSDGEALRATIAQRRRFRKRVASLMEYAQAFRDMHNYYMTLQRLYVEIGQEIDALEAQR